MGCYSSHTRSNCMCLCLCELQARFKLCKWDYWLYFQAIYLHSCDEKFRQIGPTSQINYQKIFNQLKEIILRNSNTKQYQKLFAWYNQLVFDWIGSDARGVSVGDDSDSGVEDAILKINDLQLDDDTDDIYEGHQVVITFSVIVDLLAYEVKGGPCTTLDWDKFDGYCSDQCWRSGFGTGTFCSQITRVFLGNSTSNNTGISFPAVTGLAQSTPQISTASQPPLGLVANDGPRISISHFTSFSDCNPRYRSQWGGRNGR